VKLGKALGFYLTVNEIKERYALGTQTKEGVPPQKEVILGWGPQEDKFRTPREVGSPRETGTKYGKGNNSQARGGRKADS